MRIRSVNAHNQTKISHKLKSTEFPVRNLWVKAKTTYFIMDVLGGAHINVQPPNLLCQINDTGDNIISIGKNEKNYLIGIVWGKYRTTPILCQQPARGSAPLIQN